MTVTDHLKEIDHVLHQLTAAGAKTAIHKGQWCKRLRLGFTCHLPGWKQNGFKTANNKPVKHQHLFQACDDITCEHDMIVYWKKVKGHSKQPGPDKDLNDQMDALAKAGALH
ncbi:ribonuclease H-like, partial [Sinocyclocheilus rhinocerous]|uniref:ribonuclease H-like n=1 Tax=Sinocyclocheilus rhinocerous TaxID=307959 RepID=UPI0007B7CAB9